MPLWVYTVPAKKYNNPQRMMSYRKQIELPVPPVISYFL